MPKIFRISKINYYLVFFLLFPLTKLCYQIFNQNYPKIDSQIQITIQEARNFLLDIVFKLTYQIGGAYITGLLVLIALITLLYKRYWAEAKGLVVATLGIIILVDEILKPLFDRRRPPRPRLVSDLSYESFPSGHAAGGIVFYFYLSVIIAARYPQSAKYVYALATILNLIIGFGSIYVNAHWASDILAGYLFGYIWLLVSLAFLSYWSRKQT